MEIRIDFPQRIRYSTYHCIFVKHFFVSATNFNRKIFCNFSPLPAYKGVEGREGKY